MKKAEVYEGTPERSQCTLSPGNQDDAGKDLQSSPATPAYRSNPSWTAYPHVHNWGVGLNADLADVDFLSPHTQRQSTPQNLRRSSVAHANMQAIDSPAAARNSRGPEVTQRCQGSPSAYRDLAPALSLDSMAPALALP